MRILLFKIFLIGWCDEFLNTEACILPQINDSHRRRDEIIQLKRKDNMSQVVTIVNASIHC